MPVSLIILEDKHTIIFLARDQIAAYRMEAFRYWEIVVIDRQVCPVGLVQVRQILGRGVFVTEISKCNIFIIVNVDFVPVREDLISFGLNIIINRIDA